MFASFKKFGRKSAQVIGHLLPDGSVKIASVGGLATLGASAHAALPTGVETAITSAGADMVTAVTAIITAFVAFWGLRKLGQKLGWI